MAGDPIPYCSECGEEVPADSRFCPECGASLGGERGPERSRRRSKTSIDIDENLEAALTYLLGWITGIIFLLLEKRSRYVKFHAVQSIVVFFPLWIISFIGWFLFFPFGLLIGLVTLILWLVLMVKAYQGVYFKLPVAGDIAEDQMDKI